MKKNKSKSNKIRKYIISLLIIVLSVVAITPFNVFAEDIVPEEASSTSEHCYDDNSHSMPVGNIGKWFDTKNDIQQYVEALSEEWFKKYENGDITYEEYVKNSPYGYECYSCSICGKWTANLKYR